MTETDLKREFVCREYGFSINSKTFMSSGKWPFLTLKICLKFLQISVMNGQTVILYK